MTFKEQISTTADLLRAASSPLFVWGAGMRSCANSSLALARSLGVPVACTWGAIDLVNHDDPLHVGGFGTHGTKAANLAIQNADLLLVIGCRLDTKATGTPNDFAPKAKIVMVDIDYHEIDKMPKVGRKIDLGIYTSAEDFVKELQPLVQQELHGVKLEFNWSAWIHQIWKWKAENIPQGKAYDLMKEIGEYSNEEDIIVSDTGNTLGWIMQGFPFKGERFIHAFNFTPMGYGLASAVGAAFASGKRVICIVGDGGALMSVNELATISRHDLNIKIILLNNRGHSMCRVTQRQWLGGKYYATSPEGGLGFPEWPRTAEAFGIQLYDCDWDEFFEEDGPIFMEVEIDPDEGLAFQVKYGEKLA
jgi:acetolactate synthase I/II/III large subunit